MGERNTFKWRLKNSLFFILCFIPFLQWIPFFIMNGRIPKKRWLMLAFGNILVWILFISVPVLGDVYADNNRVTYPKGSPDFPKGCPEAPAGPQVEDYLGDDWYNIDNYSDTDEYKQYKKERNDWYDSDEYKQYEADREAWYDSDVYLQYKKDVEAFESTPEYLAYRENSSRMSRIEDTTGIIGQGIGMIGWFVFMVLGFFVERYKYLRALEVNERRGNIYEQIGSNNRTMDIGGASETSTRRKIEPQKGSVEDRVADILYSAPSDDVNNQVNITKDNNPVNNIVQEPKTVIAEGNLDANRAVANNVAAPADNTAAEIVVNVNTATEAELMTLPGMKTIDAKKIIDYRNRNGKFNSKDEFFDSFEVKPHIMLKQQDKVVLNTGAAGAAGHAAEPKRRFDF